MKKWSVSACKSAYLEVHLVVRVVGIRAVRVVDIQAVRVVGNRADRVVGIQAVQVVGILAGRVVDTQVVLRHNQVVVAFGLP